MSSPSLSTPVQEFGRSMLNLAFNLHANTETARSKSPHFEELQLPLPYAQEFDSFVLINEFPTNSYLFNLYFELYSDRRRELLDQLEALYSAIAYDPLIVPEAYRQFVLKYLVVCHVEYFLDSDLNFYSLVRITQYLSEEMQYTYLINVFTVALKVIQDVDYYLTYLALGNICGQAIFNYICMQFSEILQRQFAGFQFCEGSEELFCVFLICQLVIGDDREGNIRRSADNFYRAQSDIGKVSLRCYQLLHTYILLGEE